MSITSSIPTDNVKDFFYKMGMIFESWGLQGHCIFCSAGCGYSSPCHVIPPFLPLYDDPRIEVLYNFPHEMRLYDGDALMFRLIDDGTDLILPAPLITYYFEEIRGLTGAQYRVITLWLNCMRGYLHNPRVAPLLKAHEVMAV